MSNAPVNVDVSGGMLDISTRQRVNLIQHVFDRSSDKELLKELWTRLGNAERQGA